jgi:phenylalanyl-tRNA synthetase beta chain
VTLHLREVHRLLGATVDKEGIAAENVEAVLNGLGFGLAADLGDLREGSLSWSVTLPSWRLDVEREIDLIEEIARVYGYNRFANTLPAFGEGVKALPWAEKEAAVRGTLRAAGFNEAIASTFCSAAEGALTAPQPGLVVPLGNPLSEEAGVLRPSLVPGMLAMVAGNLNRDVSDVRLFELGTVFSGTTDKVDERPSLAFGAAGALPQESALHASRAIDFHDMKGVVEQLLSRFEVKAIYFDRFPAEAGITPEWLHPYRAARVVVEGATVGWFGQLNPREAAARKLKDAVLVGEVYLDRLYKLPLRKPAAHDISRFQPVRRDFSLVLDEDITWQALDGALGELQIPELVDWRVREVFRDARLAKGEYSLLLGTTFQAPDRTLREEELQRFQARVVEAVGKVGARLRA